MAISQDKWDKAKAKYDWIETQKEFKFKGRQ